MLRIVVFSILLSFILLGSVWAGARQGWFESPSFSDEIVFFLALTHLGLYRFIVRQLGQRPEDFVRIYLGATVLRILFFGLFVFLVLWIDPLSGTGNALFFLLSYFLFTTLEVSLLYAEVTDRNPHQRGQKGP